MLSISLNGKKAFFASDLHLGIPDHAASLAREKRFIHWLNWIEPQASCLFLVGDVFDFWFEYRHAVPRGFTRLLGKLAALTDSGLPVYFFTGNHDQWVKNYFQSETGLTVFTTGQTIEIENKRFFIAHGDGLGPGDHGYKFLKNIFRSPVSRWLFERLHPNAGIWLGQNWSRNNQWITGEQAAFLGESKEWLITYSRHVLQKEHIDYFIFGHRHIMLDYRLSENSRYINLGDWLQHDSYAMFDGNTLLLQTYNSAGTL